METYSGGTDTTGELCYYICGSNDLAQMLNLLTQIPDCNTQRELNILFTGLTDTNFRQIKITKILKSLKILKTIMEVAPKIFKGFLLIFMIFWISYKSVFVSFRTLNFDISKAIHKVFKDYVLFLFAVVCSFTI